MDLANLISQPGPEPAMTVKSRYSPPAFEPGTFYSASTSFTRTQAPLSPPIDEKASRCSLPSISSLIDSADGASTHSTSKTSPRTTSAAPQPKLTAQPERQRLSSPSGAVPIRLPPTPPLRPGSGFHSTGHSPSSSISSTTNITANAILKSDYPQPPVTLPSPTDGRSSISSQGSINHSQQHHAHHGPYASPAPSVGAPSYSSPVEPSPSASAMYYQRPPSSGAYAAAAAPPPPPPAPAAQPMISPVTPAWQHHHYFPPSTSAPYQQNHDRYICRTCHKAFSRPSSLRIHSHSHTGEKPFRCTHAGCGKAFSVRSNMKRHERGCHTGRAAAMV